MDQTWYKWDYVCLNCDSLIEMTIKVTGKPHISLCPVCLVDPVSMSLMSVVDATINPINQPEQKEETMSILNNLEANLNTPLSPAENYNPNALVTYKKIVNGQAEYVTEKVTDIDWALNKGRISDETNAKFNDKVFKLENILSSYCQEATDPDMELITEIANLFDIRLTKDISFSGTMSFSGTITVDLTEDFDLHDLISETLSVDAFSGDVEIDGYEVDEVRESSY